MASGICYTQSGTEKRYESVFFSNAIGHYPIAFSHNIIGPDSNGNYTITYEGYDDANSSNYDCYCKTIYGDFRNGGGVSKTFYFKKKSYVYVSLSCSDDIVLNNVVYHPYNSTEQTIHTIDMSISGDEYIDIVIGLSSKYHGGAFYLFFKDSNGNRITIEKYQSIQLVVDLDLGFPVDNKNSRCIISKYSNTLEEVGDIFTSIYTDGISHSFGSSGWSNNTLYTPSSWTIEGGAPGPSNMKIDHYQFSFKITLDGYTRTIWLTTKIQSIRHFG